MGWRETHVQDERLRFIEQVEAREQTLAELCRRYGISRKTGYKWLERYEQEGLAGLADRSRRPRHQPRAVDEETIGAILEARGRYPSWGERKIQAWLARERPEREWPAASTIGAILKRYGLTRPGKRRRRASPSHELLAPSAANQVWAIDFKGWFRDRRRPALRAADDLRHCTAAICCAAKPSTGRAGGFCGRCWRRRSASTACRSASARTTVAPFASTGIGGLSRLSVWWVRLGIVPERIKPGHPEQNGRHERLHRTLKQATATPPARTGRAQQRLFDRFRSEYNHERPHEALGMATPASVYGPSPRPFPERLPEIEYPAGFAPRRVEVHGAIDWRFGRLFLGEALAGQTVGLEEVEDGWRIWFGPLALARLDARQLRDPKRLRDRRGRGRWQAQFLDGCGRPPGSRRRPKTNTGKDPHNSDLSADLNP